MASEVRVHVRLGAVRLDFEGDRTFYEQHVEQLVDAAARAGHAPPPSALASGNGKHTPPAPAPAEVPPALEGDVGDDDAPRASGFAPQSGEFGRFVRRLGSEAAEPDRQVAAFAFYLWNYEKLESFGEGEMVGCFKALGLTPPAELRSILDDLTDRRRFLESGPSAASWRLSRKGENYVKTRLLAS